MKPLNLDSKDIILADATIISGLLILLTISSFSPSEFPNRSIFVSITVPIVAVFAFSAIEVLEGNNKIDKARKFAKVGFIMIVIFMVFLATVNIINVIDPNFWHTTPIAGKVISNTNKTASNGNSYGESSKNK